MTLPLAQLSKTPVIQPGTQGQMNKPWVDFFHGVGVAIEGAGVSSLNALVGALVITGSGGITVTASGTTIQIGVSLPAVAALKGDAFTPDSTTQDWTLSSTPSGIVILVWNNLVRAFSEYSVAGTMLTTTFTAATGDNLFAIYI